MDGCASLLAGANVYHATPQAAYTDVASADQYLEIAVHAPDAASCTAALAQCAAWLRYAQSTYGPDNVWSDRAACAAATVESWTVPTDPGALAAFQTGTLFGFHGVIAALVVDATTYGPVRDSSYAEWAILGAALAVLAGWSYIDFKQGHGGYPRSPAASSAQLVAYRY